MLKRIIIKIKDPVFRYGVIVTVIVFAALLLAGIIL
jgi:hypothetical protein